MRCDKPAYFMENGTELPARSNESALFDVLILREIPDGNTVVGPHGGLRRRLELMLSESKKAEKDFNLRASSLGKHVQPNPPGGDRCSPVSRDRG